MARTGRVNGKYRAVSGEAITTSNTADNQWDAIYVGTGGNIRLKLANMTAREDWLTFVNVSSGDTLRFATKHIATTGTTASNLIGLIVE